MRYNGESVSMDREQQEGQKMEYGLIGAKLGHSHSPRIHKAFFPYDYTLREVPEEELPVFLEKRAFQGLNVTIPYKQAVIPFCQELGETARRIGSVNTLVVRPDGSLYGDNTDHYGMCYAIRRGGIDLAGKHVLILGSGGTSRTAQAVATDLGAGRVTVVSRRGPVDYEAVYALQDAGIVINTTPLGMFPNNGTAALDLSRFPNLTGVVDVVYNPLQTALLLQAAQLGIPHTNGLGMLVAQAKRAGELFTGTAVPEEKLDAVCREITAQVTNIVLTGMPGSGKSTVGQAVAEALGRPFYDADTEIEKRAGRTIPELFEKEGEGAFRDLEHQVLTDLGKRSGVVIATGGGAVCFARNLPCLWENGRVYCLRRPLDSLPTDGRPLSTSRQRLEEMGRERAPFYRRAAQVLVDNSGPLERAVAAILKDFGR